MAEHDVKVEDELSKEVLAPPQGIREDLVGTAVKFLQNPKVTQSPLGQKRAFLQRKGLTDEEVEEAVKRAGAVDSTPPAPVAGAQYTTNTGTPGQTLAVSPVIPQKIQEPVYSKWMRARDMIAVISVVTGLSYAALRLYKELIRPMLFGIPSTDDRLSLLEKNMSESMEKINETLAGIQQVLGKQQEKLQNISHDINSKTTNAGMGAMQKETSVSELKSELTSLKGLLLNRRQFPSMPTSVPSLPAWQLASETDDKPDSEGNMNSKGDDEDLTGETTPEISLSSTPSQITAAGAASETNTDTVKLSTTGNQSPKDNVEPGSPDISTVEIHELDKEGDGLQNGDTLEVKGLVDDEDDVNLVPNGDDVSNTTVNGDDDDKESTESLD